LSSFHRTDGSQLKKLLSNEGFREQLIAKVSTDLANKVKHNRVTRPSNKYENRTSELRKEMNQRKIREKQEYRDAFEEKVLFQ